MKGQSKANLIVGILDARWTAWEGKFTSGCDILLKPPADDSSQDSLQASPHDNSHAYEMPTCTMEDEMVPIPAHIEFEFESREARFFL